VSYPSFYFFQLFFCSYYYYWFFFFGTGEGKDLLRRARSGHVAMLGEDIFELKIRHFNLQALAFPSVLYTKTIFKEFSAHSIAFNRCVLCFILLDGS
jgi:hypothetical protein